MDYHEIIRLILDENDATVGGGCASALSGAFACGLIGMVVKLSKGKEFGYSDEEYDRMLEELAKYKEELLEGSVKDRAAYLLIRDAYRYPKATDEEKMQRKEKIECAGIKAAEVPLENAKLNHRVYEMGKALWDRSNPSCRTDLEAGIALSRLGIEAGIANVEGNLPLIKDEKCITSFKAAVAQLRQTEVTNGMD